jgi:hypothetical protein
VNPVKKKVQDTGDKIRRGPSVSFGLNDYQRRWRSDLACHTYPTETIAVILHILVDAELLDKFFLQLNLGLRGDKNNKKGSA